MIKFLAGGKALVLNKLYQNIAKCHKFKSRPDVDMIKLQESAPRCFVENKNWIFALALPFYLSGYHHTDCLWPLTNTICVSITQYPISGKLFSEQLMYQVMMKEDLLS